MTTTSLRSTSPGWTSSSRTFLCRPRTLSALALGLVLLIFAGCATNRFERPQVGTAQRGVASWYGEPFHGRATASGEIYDMHKLTAAHKELPLGTVVDVLNLDNGKSVTVRVNDRGPFVKGRIIDLSYGAAKKVGMVGPGTAKVEVRVRQLGDGPSGPNMSTRFTVQVGAFQDENNALKLRDELSASFPDVHVVRDGPWHRVRVGKYSRQKDADEAQRQLKNRDLPALVIALN